MSSRRSSVSLFLTGLVLLAGLLAGCGGGGDQSGDGSQEGDAGGAEEQGGEAQDGEGGEAQDGEAGTGQAPQVKIALGTIESVQPDRRRIVLQPSTEIQGGEQITFKVRKNAEIELNNQEAEMTDIQAGQQAQIQYVTKNEVNRARTVKVVGGGG